MVLIKKGKQTSVLDITLRNFLSYMLSSRDKFCNELSNEYTDKEKFIFIYNCALNTIDEYIHNHDTFLLSYISTRSITNLFKENFLLRQFERNEINISISQKTKNIIKEFKYLQEDLNQLDKNYIIRNVNDIITSTI